MDEHGDWVWLHNRLSDHKLMASDYERLAKRFAVIYKDKFGLGEGDVIHLCVGNNNYQFGAVGGIWILGGVASCGDIALDENAIAGQLRDTGAKLIICNPDTHNNVRRAVEKVMSTSKKKIHVMCFGDVDGCENILAMMENTDESMAPEPHVAKDVKKEMCIIFWTSGTTGLPKGICHSHFTAWHFPGYLMTMMQPHTDAVSTTCFFHVGGFFTGTVALVKHQTFHHVNGNFVVFPSFTTFFFRCSEKTSSWRSCSTPSWR